MVRRKIVETWKDRNDGVRYERLSCGHMQPMAPMTEERAITKKTDTCDQCEEDVIMSYDLESLPTSHE